MFINYEDVLCTYVTYKLNQSFEEKCRFPSNVTNICGNFNSANIEPSVHLLIFFWPNVLSAGKTGEIRK